MIYLSVTGAHSGCGKTTVVEYLLRNLRGTWGALKYTKTAFYTSISDETEDSPEGKDTYRMRESGAKKVIRIQAPPEELSSTLDIALSLLHPVDGVITEGNSLIEFLKPDIVIFVFGDDHNRVKPSAKDILKRADLYVSVKKEGLYEGKKIFKLEDGFLKEVNNRIEKRFIKERLAKKAQKGKITCSALRAFAEQEGIPYKEAGKLANELKIKIINCDLGCF